MEIPVSILVNCKVLQGIINVPDHQRDRPVVVIMCYGFNGDRVEQHRMSVTMARLFAKKGINFCRFDFRNQGLSDGSFDDFVFCEKKTDISQIIDFWKACFRSDDISFYLIGFSNGCKVAIDSLEANSDINGLILWNPILQELSQKNSDAGDSRRLYRHPITGKPYKRFYSLRLNTTLLRELANDTSMTKLQNSNNKIFCVLSTADPSIKKFNESVSNLNNKRNIEVEYVDNTDHLFGSVDKVQHVINRTFDWIINVESQSVRSNHENKRINT